MSISGEGKFGRRLKVRVVVIGEPAANIGVEMLVVKANPADGRIAPALVSTVVASFVILALACGSIIQHALQERRVLSVVGLGIFHCANLEILILNLSVALLRPTLEPLELTPMLPTAVRTAVCAAGAFGAVRRPRANLATKIVAMVAIFLGQAWLSDGELIAVAALIAMGALVHLVATTAGSLNRHRHLLPPVSLATSMAAASLLFCATRASAFVILCAAVALGGATYTYHLSHRIGSVYPKGEDYAQH